MYCPKCSQEQSVENIRFCSRCGFLLTGIATVIQNEGIIPSVKNREKEQFLTPEKKGLRQGLFLLVLAILLSPILMIIAKEMDIRPAMFILVLFTLFTIGIVRMIYAKMFESSEPSEKTSEESVFQTSQNILSNKKNAKTLPFAQSNPVSDFVPPIQGNWRDTNDLVFSSVTDATTKQLKKD